MTEQKDENIKFKSIKPDKVYDELYEMFRHHEVWTKGEIEMILNRWYLTTFTRTKIKRNNK